MGEFMAEIGRPKAAEWNIIGYQPLFRPMAFLVLKI